MESSSSLHLVAVSLAFYFQWLHAQMPDAPTTWRNTCREPAALAARLKSLRTAELRAAAWWGRPLRRCSSCGSTARRVLHPQPPMLTEQAMQTLAAQRLLLVRPATPCNARQVRAGGTGGWKSQPCRTPFALSFRRDYVQNPTCKRIGCTGGDAWVMCLVNYSVYLCASVAWCLWADAATCCQPSA